MLEIFINFIFDIGYIGLFIYMVIVGTFIPLPTQAVLLPAGYLVSIGKMDFITLALITTLGSTSGALINYIFANKIVRRVLLKRRKILRRVKKFFDKYGKLSILLAPLTPGMGQYISIPAGLSKMKLFWFLPLTYISNFIWNVLMISIGYFFGKEAENSANILILIITIILIVDILLYFFIKNYKKKVIIENN